MSVKVSVVVPTYNHEKSIKSCLDSILIQQTDFDYNILVADDASTDGTKQIILEYAKKYPDKIVPLIREENVGVADNVHGVLCKVNGTYFAYLEGDDAWTDPDKLQQQVELMDKHPEIDLCGHNTSYFSEGEPEKNLITDSFSKTVNILKDESIIRVHPNSRLYRNIYDFTKVSDATNVIFDTAIFGFYILQNPQLIYIDKVMSVYNYTGEGVYSGSHKMRRRLMAIKAVDGLRNAMSKPSEHEDYFYNRFRKQLRKLDRFIFKFMYMRDANKAYKNMIEKYEKLSNRKDT